MSPKTLIIAEAGVNHNGSMELAYKMILAAKEAGADIIKFQTFKAENVMSKFAEKAEYQKESTGNKETQLEMVKKLELSFEEFIALKKYCDKVGVCFMSTPFDHDSIDFLASLEMDTWKIPSGEITNLPYLIKIAKLQKKVILSTGMSTMEEVREAVQILTKYGTKDITLLHCTTEYPTPFLDVNLLAMKTLEREFKLKVGYSDHTKGVEVPVAAVALGATVIEKHFTLDKNMEGPDHQASLEPHELKKMVASIRNVELALGDGIKKPAESEIKNIVIARKSLIAKRDILEGEVFTDENITVKRPGSGISPMKWFDVIGMTAKKDFKEDELLEI